MKYKGEDTVINNSGVLLCVNYVLFSRELREILFSNKFGLDLTYFSPFELIEEIRNGYSFLTQIDYRRKRIYLLCFQD